MTYRRECRASVRKCVISIAGIRRQAIDTIGLKESDPGYQALRKMDFYFHKLFRVCDDCQLESKDERDVEGTD